VYNLPLITTVSMSITPIRPLQPPLASNAVIALYNLRAITLLDDDKEKKKRIITIIPNKHERLMSLIRLKYVFRKKKKISRI